MEPKKVGIFSQNILQSVNFTHLCNENLLAANVLASLDGGLSFLDLAALLLSVGL